ncbi:MAG: dehydrogenase [Acidobacteriia bacterium]|nr:dehydrogenase [Terriglobia bacterium]
MVAIRSRAPLRLGLAGGGTDVSPYCDLFGGAVLNATIDRYAHCTIEPRNDGKITIEAMDLEVRESMDAESILAPTGPLKLHKSVYNRIVREHNAGNPLSFSLTSWSDAPPGSGLGASSTLVVAMVGAFAEWLRLPLGEYDIAHCAFVVERMDLALAGGKQDQYAAAFGGVNLIEFYADDRVIVNPLRVKDWILNELEASLVLYFTGLSRESARIIDEQIKNTQTGSEPSVEAMHAMKADVRRMKEAILFGDIRRFAEILGTSWQAKKRMAHGISNDHIEQIAQCALAAGAVSGKVSGAGGGGYMMFVVPPCRRLALVNALGRNGGEVMDFHFTKEGVTAWRTGNGAFD